MTLKNCKYLFLFFNLIFLFSCTINYQRNENRVLNDCHEEDYYSDSANTLTLKYVSTIKKALNIEPIDSGLVFYYLPSFENEQVCIIDFSLMDLNVITISPLYSSIWSRIVNKVMKDSFVSEMQTISIIKTRNDTTQFINNLSTDSIIKLRSIYRRCKPPSKSQIFILDGTTFFIEVYINGCIQNRFEFHDTKYDDKRYKTLADNFNRYLFFDNTKINDLINRADSTRKINSK